MKKNSKTSGHIRINKINGEAEEDEGEAVGGADDETDGWFL